MAMTTVARLALAALLFGSAAIAMWKHGKIIPTYRFHAAGYAVGALLEGVLIWLAGGWG